MSLIVVGTMAFDAIETPFGKTDRIVGGSATYVAYAASNFIQPVQQISIVGSDFPEEEMDELRSRGVQLEGVEIVPGKKSFFWSGKYHLDMNTRDTLVTDLNVLADFNPVVPDAYQGAEFLMLGNLDPNVQKKVIQQLKERPRLIVMDTMNFWMEIAISIVGSDFPEEEMDELRSRGVQLEGVEIVPGKKSFFWSGKYHLDMNTRDTLVTDLNVLADFNPVVPDAYQGAEFLMLGNLDPNVQKKVIQQLKERPRLIVMDTMNFWMEIALPQLEEVLKMVDVLLVNDSEARQLSGQFSLVKAAREILKMGPKYLIIKKGEHGALLFHEQQVFFAPALPLEEVFDPTGAGDTFAGGFIGHIAKTKDVSFDNMKTAIIVGSAMASYCVEKFGPDRLKEITREEIENRIQEFVQLVNFDIELV